MSPSKMTMNTPKPPTGGELAGALCSPEFFQWLERAGYSTVTSDIHLALWDAWKAGQSSKSHDETAKHIKVKLFCYARRWMNENFSECKKSNPAIFYERLGLILDFVTDRKNAARGSVANDQGETQLEEML